MFSNLEILMFQHLEESSPITRTLLFTRRKFSQGNRDTFKKASKMSPQQPLWYLLTLCLFLYQLLQL